MPLIGGKSKKAFSKNVETEENAGKPPKQSLAIAYSVQRKAKKKMAYGGKAEDDANPGTPAKKPDNSRPPMADYMNKDMDPSAAPMDAEDDSMYPPQSEIMDNNNRKRFAKGGTVDGQLVPGMEEDESPGMGLYAQGGPVAGSEDTNEPSVPKRKPDDSRRPMDAYMAGQATDESPAGYTEDEKSIVDAIRAKRAIDKDSMEGMFAEGGQIPGDYNEGNIDWENGQSPYDNDNSEAYKKELYDDSQLSRQPHDSNLKGDDREMSGENEHDMGLVDRIRERMRNRRGF